MEDKNVLIWGGFGTESFFRRPMMEMFADPSLHTATKCRFRPRVMPGVNLDGLRNALLVIPGGNGFHMQGTLYNKLSNSVLQSNWTLGICAGLLVWTPANAPAPVDDNPERLAPPS